MGVAEAVHPHRSAAAGELTGQWAGPGPASSLDGVNRADLVVLAVIGFTALLGLRRGLVGSALSAAGLVVGAVVGARLAPHLLSDSTPYAPLVGLASALAGALLLEAVGTAAGRAARRTYALTPLRLVDAAGGLLFGAATGVWLVWVPGAVALHVPGQTELRRTAQRSAILLR